MRKLSCVLVGAGNRGTVYCDYSLSCPEELQVVAVVEPDALRRSQAQQRYGIAPERAFADLKAFIGAGIACDFVVNATMDQIHYETACLLIDAGYDLLLEKPITASRDELLDLQKRAREAGVQVFVCHVLRYTPFFKEVKRIISSGGIGTVMTVEMNEHVWVAHFLDSYVRGKWRSEELCGSGFLLAKSCHDTDLMCWLNNQTAPAWVASEGSRSLFIPANAPAGATEFCYNCPHNDTCLYSAQKVHLEFDSMPFQTWADMDKPIEEITRQEKEAYLKTAVYGQCAYRAGGDIVDRQSIVVGFQNGSVATFTMVGGSSKAGRRLHICGTHGEIEGNLEENRFAYRRFDRSPGNFGYEEEIIDVSQQIHASSEYAGHAGGDYAIMHDLVRHLNGEGQSLSITSLADSINGHLVVYAAEESRRQHTAVQIGTQYA